MDSPRRDWRNMSKPHKFRFFRLIVSNITNRPHRNLGMIVAFAIIAGMLFSAQYLTSGALQSLDTGMTRMGADILVVPEDYSAAAQTVILMGEPSSFFFNDSGFERISNIPGVAKASPQIYLATLSGQACCMAPVQLIAIDPEHDFTVSVWLKENPDVTMGKDDVIVGNMISGDIGSDLMFFGHIYHIAGRLAKTGMMGVDCSIFTRVEDAYVMADESGVKAVKKLTIPKGMVSAVLVKVDPGTSPATVANRIQAEIPGTKTITPNGLMSSVTGQLCSGYPAPVRFDHRSHHRLPAAPWIYLGHGGTRTPAGSCHFPGAWCNKGVCTATDAGRIFHALGRGGSYRNCVIRRNPGIFPGLHCNHVKNSLQCPHPSDSCIRWRKCPDPLHRYRRDIFLVPRNHCQPFGTLWNDP